MDPKLVSCAGSEFVDPNPKLPNYPEDIKQGKLIGFVDVAYANDLTKSLVNLVSPNSILHQSWRTICLLLMRGYNIVASHKPTKHIGFFALQDWIHVTTKDIELLHIPSIINPSDDLTKPLGWVLHSRHAQYIMGHYDDVYSK